MRSVTGTSSFVPSAREALRQSLTAENLVQEAAYLRGEGRVSFERPYGLAWFLQLAAEANIKPEFQEYALEDANTALLEMQQGKIRGAKVLRIN